MIRDASRLLPLAGFGAAFGLLEAATVVVLRRLVDPAGTLFPEVSIPASLLRLEMLREVSTLLVLWIVAHLAGRDRASRFAAFLLVFGLWDLAYYAALRLAIGWPSSPAAWDLLFLVPQPWYGPVYAPMVVALTMVICGTLALLRIAERGAFPVRARHVLGAAAGGGLVVASFLVTAPGGGPPERYRVELGAFGLAVGIAAFVDAWRDTARRGTGLVNLPAPPLTPPEAASSSGGSPTSTDPGQRVLPPRAAR